MPSLPVSFRVYRAFSGYILVQGDTFMTHIATEFQKEITGERGSALDAYRRVTYGKSNLIRFIWFECVTSILGSFPGAAGMILRRVFYRRFFKEMGRGVVIGRNVTIRHPHKITIGDGAVVDEGVVLDAKGNESTGIRIASNVILSRNTVLSCKGGSITIGDSSNFAIGCVVHAGGDVVLGKYCLLAAGCYLVGVGNHGFERTDIPMMAQHTVSRGVTLEDDVWLGAKVVVLDGILVQRGSVIGACSLVNKNIPPFSVAVGIPANVIRSRR